MDKRFVTGGALLGPAFDTLFERKDNALPALPAGTRIGKFELIEEIGRGGGSIVYLAERRDGVFAQKVALKIAHASPRLRARLLVERDVLGRMRHPKIAHIFDGGETEAGDIWFAMELVAGEHIDYYCDRFKMDWRDRLILLRDVCDAVSYAHQCNVIHRDIKPNNVLVDAQGHLKLLDFGISSDAEGASVEGGDNAALTPEFASPEQFSRGPVTLASDIYQIGRVMEELLASVPTIPRHVARNLAAIVAHATNPEPAQRYRSAADLRDDIAKALEMRPVAASAAGLPYRMEMLVRRNSRTSILLVSLFACLLIAAYLLRRSDAESLRAETEATRNESTKQFVMDMLEQSDPYSLESDESVASIAMLKNAATRIRVGLRDAPDARAELSGPVAIGLLRLGERSDARNLIDQGVSLARGLPTMAPESLARLLNAQGTIYFEDGDHQRAETLHREALTLLDESSRPLPAERAESLSGLARAANQRGDYAGALETYQNALRLRRDSLGQDHPDYAMNLHDLASTLYYLGRYADSEHYARAAADCLQKALGPDHPRLAFILSGLGVALRYQGRYDEGIEVLERSRTLLERSRTTQPRVVGTTRANLAELYRLAGRHEEALREMMAAKGILAPTGPNQAARMSLLVSRVLHDMGRYRESLELAEESRRIAVAAHDEYYPEALRASALIALVRYRLGEVEAANALARTTEAALRAQPKIPAAIRSDAMLWLGHVRSSRSLDEACALYTATVALASAVGENDANVREAREARATMACGDARQVPASAASS